MVSAVLLVHNATPQTILQFHDEMSNKLPSLKGKWNFTFKIFRNNIYSVPPELAATHETAPEASFLYTWSPSYLHDSCVTLVNKSSVAVLSHVIAEELPSNPENAKVRSSDDNSGAANKTEDLAIPNQHLHEGATSGLNDSFDTMVGQRMQSLWTQRQVIKGDGGEIYELENGNCVIRTANVTLHGNFRSFLIQIEVDHTKFTRVDQKRIFADLMEKYDIPAGKICYSVVNEDRYDAYGDLALQYAETLNF